MTDNKASDTVHALSTLAPDNSAAYAENVAQKYYGIDARASLLACEKDQIFSLQDARGENFVLRFTNPSEERSVTNLQTEAMRHIARVAPDLPIPRIIMSLNSEAEIPVVMEDARVSMVRLISFLPGVPVSQRLLDSSRQRKNIAQSLARLDIALRGFFHPAAGHELLWDLKRAAHLRALLPSISDDQGRAMVARVLDDFEKFVLPQLPHLRGQIIHNDLNFSNVMVDERNPVKVSGIIDFGDMVHAPLINELAVACSYQLNNAEDPLASVAEFINAYQQLLPLEAAELEVLFDLIKTRLVMTVTITEWRAARYPENREYILRNNPNAWRGLHRLATMTREEGIAYLYRACEVF